MIRLYIIPFTIRLEGTAILMHAFTNSSQIPCIIQARVLSSLKLHVEKIQHGADIVM
jgi:hypothetical protein